MSDMQKLRLSVEQILTAAAEEIFGVFKRSIAEIEEKLGDSSKHNNRKRRLRDTEQQTEVLIPSEQQGLSLHVDPEPPHIKEEQGEDQTMKLSLLSECTPLIEKLWMVKDDPILEHTKGEENLWTKREGEHLQGLGEADITKFPSTAPSVKSEYDEDEAQSSQLHHSQTEENTEEPEDGDDYGGSEPDSIQNKDITISDVACKSTQHQCTEEDKKCKISSELETQMTDDTTEKPFNCSVCKKGFARKYNLARHMLVHTGEKPFNCLVCKKGFTQIDSLNKHFLCHKKVRPFSCSVCNKGFTQKYHLKTHMLLHTRQGSFNCSVCKKCFTQKGGLAKHMLSHTGEKPFSCSICKKSFLSRGNLKDHMSVHAGQSAFTCSVCERGFPRRCRLIKHMLVHPGQMPFSCSVCNKKYAHEVDLNLHMLVHTLEIPF